MTSVLEHAEAGAEAGATLAPRAADDAPEPKSVFRDYVETILICVIFVIFSRAFVFQQSKIPSGSMEDTLLVGDYIMVNRFLYAPTLFDWERTLLPLRDLRRGDVVVFKQPDEPEVDYIKRVAGLPGETIEVQNGYLFVDGRRIDEPWLRDEYRTSSANHAPVVVAPGHYFMLGDHRNSSSDSRSWGLVPRQLIKGRALLIWYSFDEPRATSTYPGLRERLVAWGHKVRHFAGSTRWERCFSMIR